MKQVFVSGGTLSWLEESVDLLIATEARRLRLMDLLAVVGVVGWVERGVGCGVDDGLKMEGVEMMVGVALWMARRAVRREQSIFCGEELGNGQQGRKGHTQWSTHYSTMEDMY